MKTYLYGIWTARYFSLHLVRAELKYKFRRSKLGLLWTMINPLFLTIMMTIVLGNLLHVNMKDYAPYILSGLVVWEFMMGSVIGGCNSLIVSEPYIKQFKHPYAIFPLKTTLVNIVTFTIGLGALVIWILVTKPTNLFITMLVLPFSIICLVILGWPIATLTAFTNLKYRDFVQIAVLGMQLLWYMSPVFFTPEMFTNANVAFLVYFNPITHILNLVRAPMLYGQAPTLVDYGFVLGTAAIFYLLAIVRVRASENTLIFYF